MRASSFRTIWIMLKLGYYFLNTCLYAITLSSVGKLSRERVDRKSRWWASKMLSVINAKCMIHNPYQLQLQPEQRYIFMVNHSSLYDIPISMLALPGSVRMVAKKELFNIPLFGRTLKAGEFLAINRQNRQQAIQDLKQAQRKMESGLVLWMAPEGTRAKDGKLQPFKKGGFVLAIQAKAMIIPVGIRGANQILPKKTWHFYLNQNIDVHIGEPIDTTQYTLTNKDKLMARVRQDLLQLIGESSETPTDKP